MSVAELLPTIESLTLPEKLEILHFLNATVPQEKRAQTPLPSDFPPPGDGCPATREELERSRQQPGLYTLDEILAGLR